MFWIIISQLHYDVTAYTKGVRNNGKWGKSACMFGIMDNIKVKQTCVLGKISRAYRSLAFKTAETQVASGIPLNIKIFVIRMANCVLRYNDKCLLITMGY